MGKALTYGDTFTLPATGDMEWTIRDQRTHAYPWPGYENDSQYAGRADAIGGARRAYYDPEDGWDADGQWDDNATVEAQLSALEVHFPPRTDQEWTALHLNRYGEETSAAVQEITGGLNARTPQIAHPLVPHDVTAAHIAATAAVATLRRESDPALFERVYTAALSALRA